MPERFRVIRYGPDHDEPGDGRGRWWMLAGMLGLGLWRAWRSKDEGGKEEGGKDEAPVSEEARRQGYEPVDDVKGRGVLLSGVGLLVLVLGAMGTVSVLTGVFDGLDEPETPLQVTDGYQIIPPGPNLQQDPAIDLFELHRAEDRRLQRYGWVARRDSIVHIPIEVAMDLVAERGLPVRDTTAATEAPAQVLVPSGSGWVLEEVGVPPPRYPPYLGSSPEPNAPAPHVATELDLIRTTNDEH